LQSGDLKTGMSIRVKGRLEIATHTKLIFRDSLRELLGQHLEFFGAQQRYASISLAFRSKRFPLFFCCFLAFCCSRGGVLYRREEALEDPFRLPFGGILEVNPDIHTTWTTKSLVQSVDVVCGGEQEAGRGVRDSLGDFTEYIPAFACGNSVYSRKS
jgi:hypothetical protein